MPPLKESAYQIVFLGEKITEYIFPSYAPFINQINEILLTRKGV